MAAHPSNFTVQPFSTTNELKVCIYALTILRDADKSFLNHFFIRQKLMAELSAVCSAYNGPLLTSSNVKIGSMYAAKYDNDGRWYR